MREDKGKEGEEVEFVVVGSRFQLGDENIVVLARLSDSTPAVPKVVETSEAEPVKTGDGDTMRIVVKEKRKLIRPKKVEA